MLTHRTTKTTILKLCAIICLFLCFMAGCTKIKTRLRGLFHLQKECFCLNHNQTQGISKSQIQEKLRHGLLSQYWEKISPRLIKEQKDKGFYNQLGPQILSIEDLHYFNGPVFGQVCAKARVFLEPEKWKSYRPREYLLKNFCFHRPELKVKDIPSRAKSAALKQLLRKYFSDNHLSLSQLRQAIIDTQVKNARFNFNKKTICFDYRVRLVPALLKKITEKQYVLLHKGSQKTSKGVIREFKLSLKNRAVGDILPQYGEYLVVQLGSEGKGISTVNENGATAHFKCRCGDHYDLKIFIYHNLKLSFGFFTKILRPFEFRYDNYEKDKLEIYLKKEQNKPLSARFIMGKNEAEIDNFYIAANYNEYRFIKKGNAIRIFCNGRYRATFFTKGKGLKLITVHLNRGDLLYNIECKQLGANQ